MSLLRSGPAARSSSSRCATSLWRKIIRWAEERRTPSIIELWLSASERIRQSGIRSAIVAIDARFEIQPEVNTSAPSLPCRSASSASSFTSGWLVPAMLRVPPAPTPCLAAVSVMAEITSG